MKIIVVGGGKVGYAIAAETSREGHDVIVIEQDAGKAEKLSTALDIMVLNGNGATMPCLKEAGVSKCDLLVAATPIDELNMICCLLARKMGCPNTIARIRSQEYDEELFLLREDLGLSMTINADGAAAREIYRLLQFPGVRQRESFARNRVEIVALILDKDNPLNGKKLMDLPKVLNQRVLICAVRRGDDVSIPSGSFELAEGDEIFITAPVAQLPRLLESVGLRKRRARNVMIIGGSRCAVRLCDMLVKAGAAVKLIEREPRRCQYLAERLPDVSVICADGSRHELLRSENLSKMDAIVTLTDMDEENIFISMFAGMEGVPHAITKVNRTEYLPVCRGCGIEYVITPKELCALEVIRYIRAIQNTNAESILSLHQMVGGRVEALEFEVDEDMPNLSRTLSEIKLKPNILIACIARGRQIIFPTGGDWLQKGDTVVVVTTADRVIVELKDIFA